MRLICPLIDNCLELENYEAQSHKHKNNTLKNKKFGHQRQENITDSTKVKYVNMMTQALPAAG